MSESPVLSHAAAAAVRAAIRLAGGREVCFTCTLDADGNVATARVVARGDSTSVLAMPGFARAGELLLHNHPSGNLDPSEPDLQVAARMHDLGVGFAITDNDGSRIYVVVEVPAPVVIVPLDLGAIDADLGPDGATVQSGEPLLEDPPDVWGGVRVGVQSVQASAPLGMRAVGVRASVHQPVPVRWPATQVPALHFRLRPHGRHRPKPSPGHLPLRPDPEQVDHREVTRIVEVHRPVCLR